MRAIKLKDIFADIEQQDYKVYFARSPKNGVKPLDDYLADPNKLEFWKARNTYSTGKNHFNRPYIFSLIRDYHEEDIWLFGGVWEVVGISQTKAIDVFSIQKKMSLEYAEASKVIRFLEDNDFVSLHNGIKKRTVDVELVERMLNELRADLSQSNG